MPTYRITKYLFPTKHISSPLYIDINAQQLHKIEIPAIALTYALTYKTIYRDIFYAIF